MFGFKVKKKIHAALKSNERTHIFHKLDDMKKILILFTGEDWNEVLQISRDLKDKGKDIILWTVQLGKNGDSLTYPPDVRVIGQKDISKWLGLSSRVIDEFRKLSYDTLLDLTTKNDKSLLYLLANNSAEFCIGIREQDFKVYDLIILKEEDSNLLETYKQIKFYLNNIR
ncbi:DUF6913 domain-containing protein [Dysgonomonas termitidis]|uniref:DUF6913 domain-containing protein n=1 Tax=Dysgonomonas termitidis TaxID=1516126 RepID=A0ABV9L3R8_9BACT